MRFEYVADTDTLYITLREGPGSGAQEVADGVVLDLDAEGRVVGIEMEHASERADLDSFQVSAFLLRTAAA